MMTPIRLRVLFTHNYSDRRYLTYLTLQDQGSFHACSKLVLVPIVITPDWNQFQL